MAGAEVPPGLVREHLGRVLASGSFRGSEALRRLLRYTVETTLEGKGEELKEYTIGVAALGRPSSFDPRQDTIVRVQARKLRERLAAYYVGEGSGESCRIVYRPGSYLPAFTARGRVVAPPRTVAVLPFMNVTADESAGFFCDGLAEELIDLLARCLGLRVVARTSSFQFKGAQMDAREIGQRLGAELLIEGAVRGGGDQYRITARLLSVADGCEIWAERYDRTLRDVLELETQIAASVASVLSSGAPPSGSATDNEAVALYLRARYAWNQRTEAGLHQALELYSAATERDPRAAKAWAGIAECHLVMMMHGLEPPAVAVPKARQAASDALAIDSGLGSAPYVLGSITAVHDHQFEAAEESFRKALALDPDYASAHQAYSAVCLVPLKRFDEALHHIREAARLDPLSAPIANDVGFILYWSRRFEEAIDQCRRAIALHPGFYRTYALLGRAHAARGEYAESVEACLQARRLMGGGASFLLFVLGTLGFAHGASGNRAAARAVMEELRRLDQPLATTAYERALVATGLGDWDEAVAELKMAVERRSLWGETRHFEPLLDVLRARGLLNG